MERKREAAKQQETDLKRKKAMEQEETLRDGCKNRGVPREVSTRVVIILLSHVGPSGVLPTHKLFPHSLARSAAQITPHHF